MCKWSSLFLTFHLRVIQDSKIVETLVSYNLLGPHLKLVPHDQNVPTQDVVSLIEGEVHEH